MSDISEREEDFIEDLTEVEATPLEVFEDTSSPYVIFFMGNESEIETRGKVSAKNHLFTKSRTCTPCPYNEGEKCNYITIGLR